jgi:hypothetical protein
VRIWDYYGHQKHALMNDMNKTLDDANLQMDQDVSLHQSFVVGIFVLLLHLHFNTVVFLLINDTIHTDSC